MNSIKKTKNILVVSESNNGGVKRILSWLLGKTTFVFLRTDVDDFGIVKVDLDNAKKVFRINDKNYETADFDNIYFHHGALQISSLTGVRMFVEDVRDFETALKYYRTAYEVSYRELVEDLIQIHSTIGTNNGGRINKIKMLQVAKASGLQIPKTLLTTRKSDLVDFLDKRNVITKSLDLNIFFGDADKGKLIHGLTSEILPEQIIDFPEQFPLTLFQENIDKILEIRVFFIGNKNFASAIFSQNSDQTRQDYRNYNDSAPNRIIPFKLDLDLETKINVFKKKSGLKTGSVDFILAKDQLYYFLEINPQGQFLGVSDACNFYLDKRVAEYFIG